MPDFALGSADPKITPDPGAGAFDSESSSLDTLAFQAAFWRYKFEAVALIGPNAVRHMDHYLGESGDDYTIDLEDMVSSVPSAKVLFEREQALAKTYVESLVVGTHAFTSGRAVNGYNRQGESSDWYFAIGGYSVWSKGVATVAASGGARGYMMLWEYKFFDRYNWDGGKKVKLFGVTITDAFMGRMHREGIAKEFNCYGSVTRMIPWGAPSAIPPAPSSGGGR